MKKMPAQSDEINFRQSGGINFRKAVADDIDKMVALDEMCFAVPWSKADFKKEISSNPLALYIVSEIDGDIIGYAGLWCIVDEGHITNIAVHPDFRRRKIGKNLVEILMEEGKKKGVRDFTLEVRVSNEAGIKLYEGFGFKEAGRRKNYYSNNREDAAIMWLMGNN